MISRQRLKIFVSRLLKRRPVGRFSTRVVQFAGSPTLQEIYRHSAVMTLSPEEAAEAVLGVSVDYADEYLQVAQRLRVQSAGLDRRYPDYFGVGDGTAYLLYVLVRHQRPTLAVEVGVADGRSTQVILSALDANESGRLISVDINHDVGGAAGGHPRWTLHVLSPGRSSHRQLRNLLSAAGPLDFFFHDASHTYYDQYADYIAAWEHMRPGSLFMSDDVDWSFAFLDLARYLRLNPVVLVDQRKAVGVLLRSDHEVRTIGRSNSPLSTYV
jgi:predicted O-methyltransferase YrrM